MIGAGLGWLSTIGTVLGIILFAVSCLTAAGRLSDIHNGGNEK